MEWWLWLPPRSRRGHGRFALEPRKANSKHFTGFGRAGHWFALKRYRVEPDILTFASGYLCPWIGLWSFVPLHTWCDDVRSLRRPVDTCRHALRPSDLVREKRLMGTVELVTDRHRKAGFDPAQKVIARMLPERL